MKLVCALALLAACVTGQTSVNYTEIAQEIRERLSFPSFDDGSIGPILVRLSWHSSGTYSKVDGTGGSNGATMRFLPESGYGADTGLNLARDFLQPIKDLHPEIPYSDLWILAGYTALEAMGGPHIEFHGGRRDALNGSTCPPDGRLPDASKGADHIRAVFGRMGFTDQETVALIGGHSLGRCHYKNSGYNGPWTFTPTRFDNSFFTLLFGLPWKYIQDPVSGKWVYTYSDPNHNIIMLPTDMALTTDPAFKVIAQEYANNNTKFVNDFGVAFKKLTELGCPWMQYFHRGRK
eukprot:TRINITY_DN54255_c0_g1_i1.p1 TRINITY_DN54255_c0_g1~~TRINITY_DN54255_c0_g1_i1.p1  ORF type:complete len:292 (-),score=46.88 TRINITY_DN54255_c0_g1_i1:41-916(-)